MTTVAMFDVIRIIAVFYSVGVAAIMTFAYGHLVLTEYFEKRSIPLWLVIVLGIVYLLAAVLCAWVICSLYFGGSL